MAERIVAKFTPQTKTMMKRNISIRGVAALTLLSIIIFLFVLLLASGCKHEPPVIPDAADAITGNGNNGAGGTGGITYNENTCDPDNVYFTNDILPLFISNCAKSGCHDATTHREGIILNSYQNIISTGDVRPHDPSHGKILEVITTTETDDIMPPPPASHLTPSQINMITTWINQGALNNSCSGHCDTLLVTYSATVAPLLQAKCVGCHNNISSSGNVNLSNYSGVLVVAANTKLVGTINHDPGYAAMPLGGNKMPQCEIDEITIWVNAGAPNN
jgi:hypothetical protein